MDRKYIMTIIKLFPRLLLTTPLIYLTYIYATRHNPDDVCTSTIDPIIDFIVAICCILALLALFVKRKGKTPRAEPITLVIICTSVLVWISTAILPGHTNGKLWIEAKYKRNISPFDKTTLTLKHNGNFTLDFFHVDFGCTISGAFRKSGDTIYLDDESIEKAGNEMDAAYVIKNDSLIPLNSTDSTKQFNIITIK